MAKLKMGRGWAWQWSEALHAKALIFLRKGSEEITKAPLMEGDNIASLSSWLFWVFKQL